MSASNLIEKFPKEIAIDPVFDPGNIHCVREQSAEWEQELFSRAYGNKNGPFDAVCGRLRNGFSVLVYLHGNCMRAAAQYAIVHAGSGGDPWSEFGVPTEKTIALQELWKAPKSLVERVVKWWNKGEYTQPRAIWHNLDLLFGIEDASLLQQQEPRDALFSLTVAIRTGVVLGLADISAGRLPNEVERLFNETKTLDEIELHRFLNLLPHELRRKMAGWHGSKEAAVGPAVQVASRLRWEDPFRAYKIMATTAAHAASWADFLNGIWKATRSIEFKDPPGNAAATVPFVKTAGFAEETLIQIHEQIVKPFESWKSFSGVPKELIRQLRLLPRGVVLEGPPGTGKTHLARKTGEAIGLPYRIVSSADVKSKWFGDPERNVHRLFRDARRAAPCVLVFDDADNLMPDRSNLQGSVASTEQSVVNAFLQELEGFEEDSSGILVILTTNRYASLDPALRQRLGDPIRIPYVLSRKQIEALLEVLSGEEEFHFSMDETVKTELVDLFMGWVFPEEGKNAPKGAITDEEIRKEVEVRFACNDNLFAPRIIIEAIRRLHANCSRNSDGVFLPSAEDVARLKKHYEHIARSQRIIAK